MALVRQCCPSARDSGLPSGFCVRVQGAAGRPPGRDSGPGGEGGATVLRSDRGRVRPGFSPTSAGGGPSHPRRLGRGAGATPAAPGYPVRHVWASRELLTTQAWTEKATCRISFRSIYAQSHLCKMSRMVSSAEPEAERSGLQVPRDERGESGGGQGPPGGVDAQPHGHTRARSARSKMVSSMDCELYLNKK